MLCLQRGVGQRIMLGADIEIAVLEVRRSDAKVRLGISAPDSIPVHRMEIFNAIVAKGEFIPSVGAMVQELYQLRIENAKLKLELATREVIP